MNLVQKHYSRIDVKEEIAEYCKGRWVAIHCELKDEKGVPIMLRYSPSTRLPLTIDSPTDIDKLLRELRRFRPRSFYATAHTYRNLRIREDTLDRANITSSMPTWDIDSKDGDWRKVIEKAREIVGILEDYSLSKSVFIKWSGRGAHIHINPEAFSEEVRGKIDPLDMAYSVTQFVINRLSPVEGVVVENKIDLQRVFTAPLSLHRFLDRVAVCLTPEELDSFEIEWTSPGDFRHNPRAWRRYMRGEGDELAEKAFFAVGPYISGRRRRRVHKPLDQQINETFKRLGEVP